MLSKWLDQFNDLNNRPTVSRLIHNLTWIMLERLLQVLLSVGVGMMVARHLHPNGMGVLFTIQATIGVLSIPILMGMDPIALQWMTRYPRQWDRILRAAMYPRWVLAIGMGVIVLVGGFGIPDGVSWPILVLMGVHGMGLSMGIMSRALESRHEAHLVSKINLAILLVGAILKYIGVMSHQGVPWFYGVIVGEVLLIACCQLSILWQRGFRLWGGGARLIKPLLIQAWPHMMGMGVVLLYQRLDQGMVYLLSGNVEAGYYGVATRLSEYVTMIPMALFPVLSPIFTALKVNNKTVFLHRLSQLSVGMMIVGGAVLGLMWLIAPWGIPLAFGPLFAPAVPIFRVHCLAMFFFFQVIVLMIYTMNCKTQLYKLALDVVALLLNIALNWMLIPKWGGVGAAWATVVAYAFVMGVGPWVFNATRDMGRIQWRVVEVAVWRDLLGLVVNQIRALRGKTLL